MRIALAQFWHESNMFSSQRTTLEAFRETEYLFGSDIIEKHAGLQTYVGGMIAAARDLDVELIPVVSMSHSPSALLASEAFNKMRSDFRGAFASLNHIDGICLAFHGSAAAENADDPEGVLLRDLRLLYGQNVPIVASLDLHANISRDMFELSTGLFGSNVYPEIDSFERGQEAMRFLIDVIRGNIQPVKARRHLPMLAAAVRQYTGAEPASGILRLCRSWEEHPSICDCTVYYGYADADVPFLGTHVVTIANGAQALADKVTQLVADAIWQARNEFRASPPDPRAAVAEAIAYARYPTVIAESSDNPGAGSTGSATSLLQAMLARADDIRPAAFAAITDPETVAAARAVGVGGMFRAKIGGKSSDAHSPPVVVEARVHRLTDGEYVLTGPKRTGERVSMGPTALLDVHGIGVIVSSKPQQIFDAEPFRLHGIDISRCKVVGVKSTLHFRAYYERHAAHIIVASGPGPFHPSVRKRRYTRIRQPLWLG